MGGEKYFWQARLDGRPDMFGQMKECTGQRAPARSREAWAVQTCWLARYIRTTEECTSQQVPARSKEAWANSIVGMGGWESGMGLILPPPEHGEEEPGWALCQNGHSQIIRLHVIYYNKLHSMT